MRGRNSQPEDGLTLQASYNNIGEELINGYVMPACSIKLRKEVKLLIYVLNKDGNPLIPTERCGKVRRMLKRGEANIVSRIPFTIQLSYETTNIVQDVTLGVDAGSKHIGLSATTKEKELYSGVVELRTDIVDKLSTRRELRRSRRNRKTRYRKCRFLNRRRREGWLAPSVQHKVDCHMTAIAKLYKLLPIKSIIVEVASFDIQKIKNPEISGTEYQQGEQLGFWNVREYVLFRDGHQCQCCKGKSKDKILDVHHIESRKTGGDAPNNLITLCKTCHKGYHNGIVKLPKSIKRGMTFKDAIFMGIMRWAFYEKLKETYPNLMHTYGYITKNTRIINGLPKEHYVDARCISGNPTAEPMNYYYYSKKVRCNNRKIHKAKILKGGIHRPNQAPYLVKEFRLFDLVSYLGKPYYVFARRTSGMFDIRTLGGIKVNKGCINYKKLHLLQLRKSWLVERRGTSFHS